MDITNLKRGVTIEGLCGKIKETAIQIQLLHWAINPSMNYALHTALGEFYQGLDGFIDGFVESAQGTYDTKFTIEIKSIVTSHELRTPLVILMGFKEYLNSARSVIPHSHIQNQIDELLTLTNHIIYKIK